MEPEPATTTSVPDGRQRPPPRNPRTRKNAMRLADALGNIASAEGPAEIIEIGIDLMSKLSTDSPLDIALEILRGDFPLGEEDAGGGNGIRDVFIQLADKLAMDSDSIAPQLASFFATTDPAIKDAIGWESDKTLPQNWAGGLEMMRTDPTFQGERSAQLVRIMVAEMAEIIPEWEAKVASVRMVIGSVPYRRRHEADDNGWLSDLLVTIGALSEAGSGHHVSPSATTPHWLTTTVGDEDVRLILRAFGYNPDTQMLDALPRTRDVTASVVTLTGMMDATPDPQTASETVYRILTDYAEFLFRNLKDDESSAGNGGIFSASAAGTINGLRVDGASDESSMSVHERHPS